MILQNALPLPGKSLVTGLQTSYSELDEDLHGDGRVAADTLAKQVNGEVQEKLMEAHRNTSHDAHTKAATDCKKDSRADTGLKKDTEASIDCEKDYPAVIECQKDCTTAIDIQKDSSDNIGCEKGECISLTMLESNAIDEHRCDVMSGSRNGHQGSPLLPKYSEVQHIQ